MSSVNLQPTINYSTPVNQAAIYLLACVWAHYVEREPSSVRLKRPKMPLSYWSQAWRYRQSKHSYVHTYACLSLLRKEKKMASQTHSAEWIKLKVIDLFLSLEESILQANTEFRFVPGLSICYWISMGVAIFSSLSAIMISSFAYFS